MMSTTRRGGMIGLAAVAGFAMAAPAGVDTITFDELAVGTEIHGQTLLGYATFSTQVQTTASPTVEVEGVPVPGEYGSGAFLVGAFDDFIVIDLATPVTRVSVGFTIDDTIHSSVQMHLQGHAADGSILVFEQGFPTVSGTWPAVLGDSASGTMVIESAEPIYQVGMSFALDVFATSFAIDNIEFVRASCNAADLAEPFGAVDFSDVVAFLGAFGEQSPLADLAAPFGTWDFNDVIEFLNAFGAGCP